MKKIIFLEGLPGVGKTTIINKIKTFKNINVVDEVVNKEENKNRTLYYLKNDEIKINMYDEGIIVIDRGLLSTISYEQTKKIIDATYDNELALKWFDKNKDIYKSKEVKTIYLKRPNNKYMLPYNDENDPYGSINNQKLLESISIYNLEKYSVNHKIINYSYDNMEDVINEIIG